MHKCPKIGRCMGEDSGRVKVKLVVPTTRSDHIYSIIAFIHTQSAFIRHSKMEGPRLSTSSQHAHLMNHLRHHDDSLLASIPDPEKAWDLFYDTISGWSELHYTLCETTVTQQKSARQKSARQKRAD